MVNRVFLSQYNSTFTQIWSIALYYFAHVKALFCYCHKYRNYCLEFKVNNNSLAPPLCDLSQPRRGSWRPIRRRAWWCPTWWLLEWASGSPSAPGPLYAFSTPRLWNTYRTSTSQHQYTTLCLVRHRNAFVLLCPSVAVSSITTFCDILLFLILNRHLDSHANLFETCFLSHLESAIIQTSPCVAHRKCSLLAQVLVDISVGVVPDSCCYGSLAKPSPFFLKPHFI